MKRPGDVSVRCTLLLMLDYQVRMEWVGGEAVEPRSLWRFRLSESSDNPASRHLSDKQPSVQTACQTPSSGARHPPQGPRETR